MNADIRNYLIYCVSRVLPKQANYIAVDKNREIWVFDKEPTADPDFDAWDNVNKRYADQIGILPFHIPFRGDTWKACCASIKELQVSSPITIKSLVADAHSNAVTKGFWKKDREIGTSLMLIVSELGEALEADRNHLWSKESIPPITEYDSTENYLEAFEIFQKDTFEDEIADVFIRLADLCGRYHIDIESFIRAKLHYNAHRPHKHGKEY